MRAIFKLFVASVVAFTPLASAVHANETSISDIKAALTARITDGPAVGMVVGIIDNDQRSTFGVGLDAKLDGKVPDENTLFAIGSITKTMATILLADMHLNGELQLDDPVAAFLPDGVTMPTRDGKQITLLDLATHTSGLPRMPDNFHYSDPRNPFADYTVQDLYEFTSSYTLPREIGEKIEYSNVGMGLLGHVLALRAGKSFEELLIERILKPLGMQDTAINLSAEQKSRLATGYGDDGSQATHWDIPALGAAGAVKSSANDMLLYLAANMGLVEASISEAIMLTHEIQRKFDSADRHVGLAWIIEPEIDGPIVWHNGATEGFKAYLSFYKNKKRGAFVLMNASDNQNLVGRSILSGDLASLKFEETKTIAEE